MLFLIFSHILYIILQFQMFILNVAKVSNNEANICRRNQALNLICSLQEYPLTYQCIKYFSIFLLHDGAHFFIAPVLI